MRCVFLRGGLSLEAGVLDAVPNCERRPLSCLDADR